MKLLTRFMLAALCVIALSVSFSFEANATNLSPVLPVKCLDANGSACRVEIYTAGTTTPYTVYTDQARSTGGTTVVTADANGYFADYYCDPADTLKFVVTDNGDTETYLTQDDVDCPLGASETSDVLAALGLDGSAASATLGTSGDVLCKVNANCVISGAWQFTTAPYLSSTAAGATEAPTLELYRNSASPAASDVIGGVSFTGEDSNGNKVDAYGRVTGEIVDPTDTSEDGKTCLSAMVAGTETKIICVDSGGLDVLSGSIERNGTEVSDVYELTATDYNDSAVLTFAHGASCTISRVQMWLINTLADCNYASGDKVPMLVDLGEDGDNCTTSWDGTNVYFSCAANLQIMNRSGAASVCSAVEANWDVDGTVWCDSFE